MVFLKTIFFYKKYFKNIFNVNYIKLRKAKTIKMKSYITELKIQGLGHEI